MYMMELQEIKDYVINYLINSGFVEALVKKLMFNSDIDYYYKDYVSEVWLAILEQKENVWQKLYDSAQDKGTSLEYEARNYFSRVIYNTVISDSSNAFRRLKKPSLTEKIQTPVQWEVMENSIPDDYIIENKIKSYE